MTAEQLAALPHAELVRRLIAAQELIALLEGEQARADALAVEVADWTKLNNQLCDHLDRKEADMERRIAALPAVAPAVRVGGDLRDRVEAYRAQHGCGLAEALDAVVRTPPARTYTEADMRAAVVRALRMTRGYTWSGVEAIIADPAAVAAIAEAGG